MARLRALVGGLVMVAAVTGDAHADAAAPARPIAETIEVEPSECLSRAALASKTAAFLHRDEVDARLSVAVTMRGADALSRLSLDGVVVGERLVQRRGLTCEEFRSVVAAALAVAIDTALLEETNAAEEPRDEVPPLVPPPSPAPVLPAVQTSRPREHRPRPPAPSQPPAWGLAVAFEPAALTTLHEPTVGAALGLVLAQRPLGRLGLSAFATLPVDTELGSGRRARVGLAAGRIDACLEPPIRKVPIAPCAAAIVGLHRVEGVVSSRASSAADSTAWGAVALGPEGTLSFGRWSVVARLEPWWVLRPSRIVTAGPAGDLSSTGPHLGLAAFLGARWTIL